MLSAALNNHISKVQFANDSQIKIIGYCSYLFDVVSLNLAQSDHIGRLLL